MLRISRATQFYFLSKFRFSSLSFCAVIFRLILAFFVKFRPIPSLVFHTTLTSFYKQYPKEKILRKKLSVTKLFIIAMAANFPDTFHLERARSQLLADLVGEKFGLQPQMTQEALSDRLQNLNLVSKNHFEDFKNINVQDHNHILYWNYLLRREIYNNATSGYPSVIGLIPYGQQCYPPHPNYLSPAELQHNNYLQMQNWGWDYPTNTSTAAAHTTNV